MVAIAGAVGVASFLIGRVIGANVT
jgi:hypothetical protein